MLCGVVAVCWSLTAVRKSGCVRSLAFLRWTLLLGRVGKTVVAEWSPTVACSWARCVAQGSLCTILGCCLDATNAVSLCYAIDPSMIHSTVSLLRERRGSVLKCGLFGVQGCAFAPI